MLLHTELYSLVVLSLTYQKYLNQKHYHQWPSNNTSVMEKNEFQFLVLDNKKAIDVKP